MVGGGGGLIEGEAYKKESSRDLLDGMKRGASSRKNGFVLILLLSTLNRFTYFGSFFFTDFQKTSHKVLLSFLLTSKKLSDKVLVTLWVTLDKSHSLITWKN